MTLQPTEDATQAASVFLVSDDADSRPFGSGEAPADDCCGVAITISWQEQTLKVSSSYRTGRCSVTILQCPRMMRTCGGRPTSLRCHPTAAWERSDAAGCFAAGVLAAGCRQGRHRNRSGQRAARSRRPSRCDAARPRSAPRLPRPLRSRGAQLILYSWSSNGADLQPMTIQNTAVATKAPCLQCAGVLKHRRGAEHPGLQAASTTCGRCQRGGAHLGAWWVRGGHRGSSVSDG